MLKFNADNVLIAYRIGAEEIDAMLEAARVLYPDNYRLMQSRMAIVGETEYRAVTKTIAEMQCELEVACGQKFVGLTPASIFRSGAEWRKKALEQWREESQRRVDEVDAELRTAVPMPRGSSFVYDPDEYHAA